MIVATNKTDRIEFGTFKECADYFNISVQLAREVCIYHRTIKGWSFVFTQEPTAKLVIKQDDTMMNFSRNLDMLIKKSNISFKQLSISTGLSIPSIKGMLTKPDVRVSTLLMFCNIFSKDPNWFFNSIDENWG